MTTPLVTRAEWGARPPKAALPTNITPQGITVHYGGGSVWKGTIGDHARCASVVRAWQAYHQDGNGWLDLAYTSIVCPHGYRFEGRGPGHRTAANGTNDGNQRSYAVCYLGGDGDPLTDVAKEAFFDEAARLGQPLRWGHREWLSTGCPGSIVWAWRQAGFPASNAAPVPGPGPTPPPTAHHHDTPLVKFAAQTPGGGIHGAVRRPNGVWVWQTNYSQVFWEVLDIQTHMANQGVAIAKDGIGGPDTLAKLRAYQRANGLTDDGVVGPNTWAKLHR